MKLKFHSDARADVREGRAFYRKRSPVAAIAFIHAIEDAVAQIREAPLRYPVGEDGARELVLPRRFPYTIVYRLNRAQDMIIIVAVAHHSREPGFWRIRR